MSKQPIYGFPCVADPNDFVPDGECCSPAELEAHRLSSPQAPAPAPFVPHGATCEADHDNGPDWGRCGQPATAIVRDANADRYVCADHQRRWQQQAQAPALPQEDR